MTWFSPDRRRRSALAAMVAVSALAMASLTAADEDLSSWQKRLPITFAGYNPPGGGTLTNFPALVIVSNTTVGAGFNYSDFQSPPYGDLRFAASDRTTPLSFEVEKWDTNGASYVWVRVTELAVTNTQIWALWGRSGVGAPACTTNGDVWDSSFRGVWHLGETNAVDSTTNRHTGTSKGNAGATGLIGTAQGFSGTNSYVDLGATPLIPSTNPWTLSGWMKPTNATAAEADFFAQYLAVANNGRILLRFNGTPNTNVDLFLGNDATHASVGVNLGKVPLHMWSHFTFSRSGSNFNGYINGVKVATSNDADAARAILQVGNFLGARSANTTNYSLNPAGFFPGFLDEFRVSGIARSSNWIWACYMNMASNGVFNSSGPAEYQPLPGVSNVGTATNVTATSAWLVGELIATGTAATAVMVYWGPSDGGASPTAWANTNTWAAPQAPGTLATNVTGLASNITYYFRFAATNDAGAVWAPATTNFITGAVWIDTLTDASEIGPTPGTFTVHRASAATNEPLMVKYSVGGTAASNVDYAALTGTVTIPAGTDAVPLVVSPCLDHFLEGAETVTVTVTPGAYVTGTSNTASMAIADAGSPVLTWGGGGATNSFLASNPTNWVGGVAPVAGDSILLNTTTNKNMTWDLNIPVQSWTQVGYMGTVTVATVYGPAGFTNLTIVGDCVISNGTWMQTANPAVNYETNRLRATIGGNMTLGTGAVIDVTAKGFTAGNGPGRYIGTYGGGSYGGRGTGGYASSPGPCYGSVIAPTNLGSSGSSGAGGGAVWLTVAGELRHDGLIAANGSNPSQYAGAGGSIYLVAGILSGTGTLQAKGGIPSGSCPGGGGRIALVITNAGATFASFAGTSQAFAGSNTAHAGTVYMEKAADGPGRGEVIVNNAGGASTSWSELNGTGAVTCEFSRITLTNAAKLTVATNNTLIVTNTAFVWSGANNGISIAGGTLQVPSVFVYSNLYIAISTNTSTFNPSTSLTIGTNAEFRADVPLTMTTDVIVAPGGNLTHTSGGGDAYKVNLTVNGSLTVQTGGLVSVVGRGFGACGGPGGSDSAGGSYGGCGKYNGGGSQPVGPCYGSIVAPTHLGSGGRNNAGGGAVWLKVVGTLRNDGVISANGGSNTSYMGSGGSVYLVAGSLVGSGMISANGGGGSIPGGGGRVALVVTNAGADFSGFTGTNQALGATGSGAGTVYLRTAAQGPNAGTLIIDNGGSTPNVTDIASNVTDAVVGDVIVRNNASLRVATNQTLTLSGLWSNGASFTAQSGGQVIFTGEASTTSRVYGSTTFMQLICTNGAKTLQFQAGVTNSVAAQGTLTFLGSSGSNLILRSMVDNTAWKFNVSTQANQNVDFVDVKDSDARPGAQITVQHYMDRGNNSNWNFAAVAAGETNEWTGYSSAAWATATNWSLGRSPFASDSVLIPSGKARYPVLSQVTIVNGLEMQAGASLTLAGYDFTVTTNATIAGTVIASSTESIMFQADVDFTGGTITQALSTILLAGSGAQRVNFANLTLFKVNVQNSAGTVTFTNGFTATEFRCEAPTGARSMVFQAGATVTARDLVWLGSPATTNLLLRSSLPGSAWKLVSTGYRRVEGVDVSDSDANQGMPIPASASRDGGNNGHWVFGVTWSTWQGTGGANFDTAANWSPAGVPDAATRVLIETTNAITATGTVRVLDLVVGGGSGASRATFHAPLTVGETINVLGNGTLTLNQPCVVSNGLYVRADGLLTHSANSATESNRLDLTVGSNMVVDVGGVVDVAGRGYVAINGPGGAAAGGGSHGGRGKDAGAGGSFGPCYGSILTPTNSGSGGRNYAGGGAIRLKVAGELRHDGTMRADGAGGASGFTGAGGSIYALMGVLNGVGSITANGGSPGAGMGPGGGGRIALVVTNAGATFAGFTGTQQALAGGTGAGAGTIYRRNGGEVPGRGTVLVDNQSLVGNTEVPPASQYVTGEVDRVSFLVTNASQFKLVTNFTIGDIMLLSGGSRLDLGSNTLYVNTGHHSLGAGSVTNYGAIVWDLPGTIFRIR